MITLITHHDPDGDAVGAVLGIRAALDAAQIRSRAYLWGTLPRWFPAMVATIGAPPFETAGYTPIRGERVVLLDAGSTTRCGAWIGDHPPRLTLIVDHHDNPPDPADVVILDPAATSTCELVVHRCTQIARALWAPIAWNRQAASWLAVGVRTDTLDFSVPGISGETLRTAAFLTDLGAPIALIAQVIRRSVTAAQLDVACALWQERQVIGSATVIVAAAERLRAARATIGDARLVFVLAGMTQDVPLVVLLGEDPVTAQVRVSVRSVTEGPALAVARALGGGGHGAAAGAVLTGSLADARARLQAVLEAGV